MADEVHGARLLVDADDLADRPLAGGDLVLQLAGREVVEVEVAPVVALGVPDHLVGGPEHAPAGDRFEVRRHDLVEHGAHVAGGGVGHAEHGRLVVARRRHERQLRGVGAPGHVVQAEVVAERGAVIVGLHLEADRRAGVDVDDDALEHRHDLVARQRVLPRLEHGVPDLRLDEVHVADLALVLLEGGDLLRVGRPEHDGAVASRPAGVVGGVAEVLHAVGGQRLLLARRHVADPEVPVLDEHGALAVGRRHGVSGARSAAAAPASGRPAAVRPWPGPRPCTQCPRRRTTSAASRRRTPRTSRRRTARSTGTAASSGRRCRRPPRRAPRPASHGRTPGPSSP